MSGGENVAQPTSTSSFEPHEVVDLAKDITSAFTRVHHHINHLAHSVDQRFDAHDQRFDNIDQRLASHDQRFDAHDRRFDSIDQRLDSLQEQQAGQMAVLEEIRSRLG